MPDWLDYQKLAAAVYEALQKNAVVIHDDKIYGHKSKVQRQIDVSIRLNIAGHELLVIVQAKDLNRPADVNVVGEFKGVVDDVQAAKGVLICSSGFSDSAVEYANSCGIDLCSAYDASSPKWALNLRLPILWLEHKLDLSYEVDLIPDQTNEKELDLEPDPRKWPISFDGGFSYENFGEFIERRFLEEAPSYEIGTTHRMHIPLKNARVLLDVTFSCPVEAVDIAYSVCRCGWSGEVRLSNVLGLLHRTTSTLHARIRITEKDIPLARDPSWLPVDDIHAFNAANPNLLTVECSAPSFADFAKQDAAINGITILMQQRQ